MSEFQVIPEALGEHAARIGRFAPDLDEARGRMAGGSGAAGGTPAGGALEHLSGHLGGKLSEFGAAAEALHRAIVAAGARYQQVDRCVEESAT